MKKVLLVFPTVWDSKQLEACRDALAGRYEIILAGPTDEERAWDFDVLGFIDEAVERYRGTVAGIFSTSDYPGATCAAAIARRLGLPGPGPESVIRCSHKYYSRLAQREVVPEATPWFALIDPRDPRAAAASLQFPCFVKPVKGAFSIMARRIDSEEELGEFLARPAAREFLGPYMHTFNQLLSDLAGLPIGGSYFLAEEMLSGRLVTVDGYCRGSEPVIQGVVDSALHSVTGSFERFDLPSALPGATLGRVEQIACRAIAGLGLADSLFNIEMMVDPDGGAIRIIEINPRMSGQFADLYEKVDGAGSYPIAIALATGDRPAVERGSGAYDAAASLPLRAYEPCRVQRAPDEAEIARIETEFPGTLVWSECRTGASLADFEHLEDGRSVRYGIVNTGAADRAALTARLERIRARLDFRFARL